MKTPADLIDMRMGRRGFLRAACLAAAGVFYGGDLCPSICAAPNVTVERVLIPLSDGIEVASTLYLPQDATREETFPVILEVLPYRKDDDFAERDYAIYSWLASRGYLGCRVDVRGTGTSYGSISDEYTIREHRDTVEIMEWLSRHPRSNGRIGMWGISYGGFNSLQVAALRPPHLNAIVSVYASDDRYTDDVHYCGGCLHAFENIWAVGMEAENAFPAYPDYSPSETRSRERFETEPWIFNWLRRQTDGPYWRHGSIRPDYDSLQVPMFLIGGWMDGYVDSVPRLLKSSNVPRKAIIGPWPHALPDEEGPWPRIHWLHEVKRWWDMWLKGEDTGVMCEPRLALFVRESHPSSDFRLKGVRIPGRWRYEEGWPPEGVEERHYFAGRDGELHGSPSGTAKIPLPYRPTVGTSGKTWAPDGDGSYGVDQREDDALCVTFTSKPLDEPLEILGFPEAVIYAVSPVSRINWIVRLNDVFPDGSSRFVSRGVLNATHRFSHSSPSPLIPGELYRLEIPLQATSWIFPRGHRIRMALSHGEWPVIWPSPFPATSRVLVGKGTPTELMLPARRPSKEEREPRFLPPEKDAPSDLFEGWEAAPSWSVARDQREGTTALSFQDEYGVKLRKENIVFSARRNVRLEASDLDPARASLEGFSTMAAHAKSGEVAVRADVSLRSDAEDFHLAVRRTMLSEGRIVRAKTWSESIPRILV